MLHVRNLKKSYRIGTSSFFALEDVSFDLPSTGLFAFLGPSGSGKTTLLSLLGALDTPDSGSILLDDNDVTRLKGKARDFYRARSVSFLFQENNLLDYLSVEENIKSKGDASKEHLEDVLTRLNIAELRHKLPHQLSTGEKERVALARALLSSAPLLLCDEPTASLDQSRAAEVMAMLLQASKDKLVLVVSHDEALCLRFTDCYFRLRDGKLIESHGIPTAKKEEKKGGVDQKPLPSRLFSRMFAHARHKARYTIAATLLSLVGFLSVSAVASLSDGCDAVVSRAEDELLRHSPLSIPYFYEDVPGFGFLMQSYSNEYQDDGVLHKDGGVDLATSLHVNVLTDSLFSSLFEASGEDVTFLSNPRQTYSFLYQDKVGDYVISESSFSSGVESYIDAFFGTSSFLGERVLSKDEFLSRNNLLSGAYPTRDDEVVLLLGQNGEMDERIFDLLGVNEGQEVGAVIGKSFRFIPDEEVYLPVEETAKTARFLKTPEQLKAEGKDERAILNILLSAVNSYYEGESEKTASSMAELRSYFLDEAEERTLHAYGKIRDQQKLSLVYGDETKTKRITVTGVAKPKANTFFADNNLGLLFSSNALSSFRKANASSSLAKDLPSHLYFPEGGSSVIAPQVYGYRNAINDGGGGGIEDSILALAKYFEDLKNFNAHRLSSELSVYATSLAGKEKVSRLLGEYNKSVGDAYQIRFLDLGANSLMAIDSYFGVIRGSLLGITIAAALISAVLLFALCLSTVHMRTKEIGLYRCLGYSRGYVYALLQSENTAFSFLGSLVGVLLTFALVPLLNPFITSLIAIKTIDVILVFTWPKAALILGLGLLASFLSSFFPCFRYSRLDPMEALRR